MRISADYTDTEAFLNYITLKNASEYKLVDIYIDNVLYKYGDIVALDTDLKYYIKYKADENGKFILNEDKTQFLREIVYVDKIEVLPRGLYY